MSDILHTPQEAIDVVPANPPMGNLPSGADGTEAGDSKGTTASGEARHMSIPEASGILMELARKRSMSLDQVNALEMAVRRLMCRHFQRQRNWAKRREAARPSATDLTQRNREAESAEPIGVRGSAPDEKKLSDLGLSAPLRETKTERTEEESA